MDNKERTKRKNQKELKSLRNKMGSNIVWFDSLNQQQQYDLLFEWKYEKFRRRNVTKPVVVRKRKLVKKGSRWIREWVDVTEYPASLKYFIKDAKLRYRPQVSRVRETTIDLLLKNS